MSVVIVNRQRTKKINLRLLKQITKAVLAELKIENAELGINLVGAKEMAELNWKFLRHEGSTDVITFDHNEPAKTRLTPSRLHGELFICGDEAISQARQFKTDWQSEIVRYIIHGILHLIGHDDFRANLRRKMKREENRLLHGISKKFSLAEIGGGSKLRS
jgi:probable rRNA maturation factor